MISDKILQKVILFLKQIFYKTPPKVIIKNLKKFSVLAVIAIIGLTFVFGVIAFRINEVRLDKNNITFNKIN